MSSGPGACISYHHVPIATDVTGHGAPAPSVPGSCMPPEDVQRKACCTVVSTEAWPTTTLPLLLTPQAAELPPPNVPRSTIPVEDFQRKARPFPFALSATPTTTWPLSLTS